MTTRTPPHVTLFDYGAGNLHSLAKGLEAGGARVTITPDWTEALSRDALILPGVGSFGAAVRALEGHADTVREALEAGLPCLGICLGMQLLFDGSEEGEGRGIGLLPGQVRRIRARVVPQMGWNDVDTTPDPLFEGLHASGSGSGVPGGEPADAPHVSAETSRGMTGDESGSGPDVTAVTSPGMTGGEHGDAPHVSAVTSSGMTAYYANSFICEATDPESVIAWSDYGEERFAAAVRRGRSWGVQFHPEKSSAAGLRLLRNFLSEVTR
ncbi:MAG: imidazole glycerol phosphate synthase subunit HisH [Gemmatimonadales bacterium]|nr:MAG: imidazole glycerol phosphate synthase subunit HisH [Gemmatimonadales bacterium]